MKTFLIAASALALGASPALAASPPNAHGQNPHGIGADVRVDAKTQRTDTEGEKGIGTSTRVRAHDQRTTGQGTTTTDVATDTKVHRGTANHPDRSARSDARAVAAARGDNRSIANDTGAVADLRAARSHDMNRIDTMGGLRGDTMMRGGGSDASMGVGAVGGIGAMAGRGLGRGH